MSLLQLKLSHRQLLLILFFSLFGIAAECGANTPDAAPTAYATSDYRSVLEIFPPHSRQNDSDRPRALLYSVASPGSGWQVLAGLAWDAQLVNPSMPAQALVLPDDRVVTINDAEHPGFDNSLVIYDRKGKLVRSIPFGELIPKDEVSNVRYTENSREWNDGARYFAVAAQSRLYIVLKWRKILKVDLSSGAIDYGDVAKFPEAIRFISTGSAPEQVISLPITLRYASITDTLAAKKERRRTAKPDVPAKDTTP